MLTINTNTGNPAIKATLYRLITGRYFWVRSSVLVGIIIAIRIGTTQIIVKAFDGLSLNVQAKLSFVIKRPIEASIAEENIRKNKRDDSNREKKRL